MHDYRGLKSRREAMEGCKVLLFWVSRWNVTCRYTRGAVVNPRSTTEANYSSEANNRENRMIEKYLFDPKERRKRKEKRPVETKENSPVIDSKANNIETSLAVQWLRFCLPKKKKSKQKRERNKTTKKPFPSDAGDAVSIPPTGLCDQNSRNKGKTILQQIQ